MHPIEVDAILKLAKNHLRSGKIPEAEQMYVRVLKEQPTCAEALHFLGLAAMQRGKLDKALELVRRSIEIDPKRADYHDNLATVLGRMNAAVEALGAAQRAIDLRDDFAEVIERMAEALLQRPHPNPLPVGEGAEGDRQRGAGGMGRRRMMANVKWS